MPAPRCEFCPARPRDEFAVSKWVSDPDDRERLTIPLCAKHQKRVQRGGNSGYEHGGARYKIGFW
ncbi:MAG TPA: hypothetical protein QF624_10040 [Dehalococcoidia bacterium]|jgi:hypothetical protein|nr:hypothetical protein [Dehalococcoidia bacterium]